MKLLTRGRYGLRAMLDLAIFANGEHAQGGYVLGDDPANITIRNSSAGFRR